ncbi:sensor histidine kinase [Labedaea rhizosphaerae]|uniref:histidine kinase n=1 Tax=Labedaea rhizosphaerae TaxID=598644 RepID=A0A4R6SBT0_LABRH|nr:ATP-binding protein [Labedaea rhizosphaerae]TDP97509.1 HAMP domain-containing protein [Labedaea rhizosphaerae]
MAEVTQAGRRRTLTTRWPLRRWLTIATAVLVVVFIGAIAVGSVAIAGLNSARTRLADDVDPGVNQTLLYTRALLDQETGVRGYALTGDRNSLDPYVSGQQAQKAMAAQLMALIGNEPGIAESLRRCNDLVAQWRTEYAEPTIARINLSGLSHGQGGAVDAGQTQFTSVRNASDQLQVAALKARDDARDELAGAATLLIVVCVVIGAVLLALFVLLMFATRAAVAGPLAELAAGVRKVADGDFDRTVQVVGPLELVQLADDVDWMRSMILAEVANQRSINAQLDEASEDLRRSNAELEQFAYVASHDLQEPLRKVASFCQLLERRYGGQLDERGEQYIAFAVDGAKRMQVLINDLLAFSRVGRHTHDQLELSSSALIDEAIRNLDQVINETGARVRVFDGPEPPIVLGEQALLTAVFQNLISNAIKFRGDDPPVIRIQVRSAEQEKAWEFSVTDNGIGIAPEYAERVFVLFQRLHGKSQYPGTGIGLAMCRKIVEYHGGRIWIDTEYTGGTRVCFTLPVLQPVTVLDEQETAANSSEAEAST